MSGARVRPPERFNRALGQPIDADASAKNVAVHPGARQKCHAEVLVEHD
jgi:hypothetical protein